MTKINTMKTTWKNQNEVNTPDGYHLLSGNDVIQTGDLTIWTFAGNDPQWKPVDAAHIGEPVKGYSVIRSNS